jgi:hypothetical protein
VFPLRQELDLYILYYSDEYFRTRKSINLLDGSQAFPVRPTALTRRTSRRILGNKVMLFFTQNVLFAFTVLPNSLSFVLFLRFGASNG